MATATWIQHDLEEAGVPFQELHHNDAYTAQSLAEREHVSGHHVAKVVAVIADGRPVELILPASRRVNLQKVRDILTAENVRLATEPELQQYFADCEIGAIPAMRHWKDVDVLMDDTLRVEGDIVFPAGTHCDAVRIAFEAWFRVVNPRVESFTEPERSFPREEAMDEWPGQDGEWI
jgi:Ala-tRNA(Pro) deacylase